MNLISLETNIVLTQWKTATIIPVPKTTTPKVPAEFRPISLTSILSRTSERLIIRKYIYPAIESAEAYCDQFAFRPSGGTTAAIIAITSKIQKILETQNYARVIAFDFSKAFDAVKHSSVLQRFEELQLPDQIYNWLVNFFSNRIHQTKFNGNISKAPSINASVIQGSAIGPIAFTAIASSLKTVEEENCMIKYADDTYLIIAENKINSTSAEIKNIVNWAKENN